MTRAAAHVSLAHMQAFLDQTNGQITIGEIPRIRRAALAAVGKKARVALLGRDGENLVQLLERLDIALAKVMADNSVIDKSCRKSSGDVRPDARRRDSMRALIRVFPTAP